MYCRGLCVFNTIILFSTENYADENVNDNTRPAKLLPENLTGPSNTGMLFVAVTANT